MRLLDRLFALILARWVPRSDVRAEAWALGGRHHGGVLQGARAELAVANLSVRRAALLTAVIRSLRH